MANSPKTRGKTEKLHKLHKAAHEVGEVAQHARHPWGVSVACNLHPAHQPTKPMEDRMLADDFDLWSQEMHDWFENIAAHYLNLLDRGGVHYHDWYEALVAWYEWQRTHADSGRG